MSLINKFLPKKISLAVIIAITGSTAVYAQESNTNSNVEEIEKIVVTARGRTETLQQIPDSVTVFSDEDIKAARITSIKDFSALTPNLNVSTNFRSGLNFVTVRGLITPQVGEAPIAYVVDGITVPNLEFINQGLHDIERIEEWDTQGFAELFGYPYPTGFRSHSDAENVTSSAALFGQVSYNLAEEWRFTVGGRYTEETKEFDISTSGLEPLFGFLTENYTVESEETWDDFSGKLSIDYMGFDNVLLYLSVGEGFKSGAFNSLAPDADQAAQAIDPELAMQVELGVKSQWLDDRIRLNAVVFSIDYQDLQVFQTTDDQRIIVTNAGQATSQGVELELIAKPLQGLDISASYSYLDATYDEYTTSGSDFSGNRLQRAPKNAYSISASYLMPLTDLGELAFRVDYLSQNKVYFNPSNAPLQVDEGYELVNARVAFEPEEGNWELALWGKNLTDEQYAVFKNDLSFIGTNSTADILGDPRTYGVTFTWNM